MRHPPAKRNGSVGHHPTAAATTQTYPPTTTLVLAGAPTNALDVPQNTPPALVRIDVRCGRRCGWTFPTFLRSDEPDMADANAALLATALVAASTHLHEAGCRRFWVSVSSPPEYGHKPIITAHGPDMAVIA